MKLGRQAGSDAFPGLGVEPVREVEADQHLAAVHGHPEVLDRGLAGRAASEEAQDEEARPGEHERPIYHRAPAGPRSGRAQGPSGPAGDAFSDRLGATGQVRPAAGNPP